MQLRTYFRKVFRHIIIWTIAGVLFTFFRNYGHEVVDSLPTRMTFFQQVKFHIMLGLVAGVLFGSYGYVIDRFLSRRFSFGRTVLLSAIGYVIVIMLLVLIVFSALTSLFDIGLEMANLKEFFNHGNYRVLIVFCFIVGFLIEFTQEVDLKFGPGNLWKMLTGKYYYPIEEDRVLMFIDMRSSTTIAEQLGHIKYSRLVQDCFKDIQVIDNYKGEIYQYVGDEVVLTWIGASAFENNNCIEAYFAFINRLKARSEHYLKYYGFVPEFKAGVNAGRITTAEVGVIKKEIAFHGDTINTAARIQGKCNDLGHDLLASASVIKQLDNTENLLSSPVGELKLRGKKSTVEIYAVELTEG